MSLGKRIILGVTAFSVETIASNMMQVVAVALVFRYLDLPTYGQLALALTFYATGGIFLDFGLGPVFTAEIAKGRGGQAWGQVKLLVTSYFMLELVMGTILFVIYIVIGTEQQGPMAMLWAIMGAYLFASSFNNSGVAVFHSYALYRRQATQSIARSAVRLLLLATFRLWWDGDPLIGVALTFPLMEFLVALISLRMAWPIIRPLWSVPIPIGSWSILWQMLKGQGLYSSIIIPVKKIQEQLPVWLITALSGNAATGVFATAQGGFAVIFSFFRGVETTLFPIVSEWLSTDPRLLRNAMQQTTKYSLWTGLLAITGGWLFAPLFVRIIAGEAYAGAVPVFRVMLLYILVYAFAQIQRPLFYATGRQRVLFISYLVNIVEYALLLVMGVLSLGATGAALSWVLSEAIIVYFRQWLLTRRDSQIAFDPGVLFVINEHDRWLWQRFVQLVQRTLPVKK